MRAVLSASQDINAQFHAECAMHRAKHGKQAPRELRKPSQIATTTGCVFEEAMTTRRVKCRRKAQTHHQARDGFFAMVTLRLRLPSAAAGFLWTSFVRVTTAAGFIRMPGGTFDDP